MTRPSLYKLNVIISLIGSIRHYFPSLGRQSEPAAGAALRESHPSEDLSELPPLLVTVAGQGYHCRLTGSWRNSLPGLFWAGWTRWAPYLAVVDAGPGPAQVVLAHPPHRLSPSSGGCQLTLFATGYSHFKEPWGGIEKPPHSISR